MSAKFKVGDKVQIAGNGLEPINVVIMNVTEPKDSPVGYYGVKCEGWEAPPGTVAGIPIHVLDRAGTRVSGFRRWIKG